MNATFWCLDLLSSSLLLGGGLQGVTPAVLTSQVTVLHRERGSPAQARGAGGTGAVEVGTGSLACLCCRRAPGKAARKALCGGRDQGPAPRIQPSSYSSRERPNGHHRLSSRVAGLGREARAPPLSDHCIFLSCSSPFSWSTHSCSVKQCFGPSS